MTKREKIAGWIGLAVVVVLLCAMLRATVISVQSQRRLEAQTNQWATVQSLTSRLAETESHLRELQDQVARWQQWATDADVNARSQHKLNQQFQTWLSAVDKRTQTSFRPPFTPMTPSQEGAAIERAQQNARIANALRDEIERGRIERERRAATRK